MKTILKLNPKSQTFRLKKGEDSQFVFIFDKGAKPAKEKLSPKDFKPTLLKFELAGQESKLQVIGLVLGSKDNIFNLHVEVKHLKPKTAGHLWFKSLLNDQSQQEMKGIIKIDKGAVQSDSYFSHRTLLMSPKARSKTTPLLEISEEDVKAGHAATTGRIDQDQLFYLRSRGLSEEQAKQTIINGFFQELVEKIRDPKIKAKVQKIIKQ